MNYETFRAEVIMKMQENGIGDMSERMTAILDSLADKYDFTTKQTQLSVVNGIPEIVKIYIASRSVENLSKNTLTHYYGILSHFFDGVKKPFTAITPNDIRFYLFNYKDQHNVKDSTLESIRVVLNGFFKWLYEEEYITKNPVRRISPIKFQYEERQPLNEIELERIRANCKTLRQKAMVDFFFSTGCRVSEASNLLIDDVNFQMKEIAIRHGKGDKFRISYLNAESIVSLKEYLLSRTDNNPYLFVSYDRPHSQLKKKSFENEIINIAKRAGITKKVTPHTFRHTAATFALRHGMNIEEVQRFLGHSKINTTMIYAKVSAESVKASHQRYVS